MNLISFILIAVVPVGIEIGIGGQNGKCCHGNKDKGDEVHGMLDAVKSAFVADFVPITPLLHRPNTPSHPHCVPSFVSRPFSRAILSIKEKKVPASAR